MDFYRDVPAAVGQAVRTRLLLFLGEWFLDTDSGTPYFQAILGKYSLENANVAIQDRVNGTQGVVDIQNYQSSLDPESRRMLAQFNIDTIYGTGQVQFASGGILPPSASFLETESGLILETESGEGIIT